MMQIVIPMAGFGERFRRAGYQTPKAFLPVGDKSILQHVVDLFPGESWFLFIVNEKDNRTFGLEEKIKSWLPTAEIVSIPCHKKGPVWTLTAAERFISDAASVVVNYCDFACSWDWAHFKNFVLSHDLDGAIPAYRGFHPHTLHSNYYAYLRCNEESLVTDIQEKVPFTQDPRSEWASSGTYYFKSGALLKKSMRAMIEENLIVNGEYYASLLYKPILREQGRIAPYPLQHFMQWGTPEDLEEFLYWFSALSAQQKSPPSHPPLSGTLLMPMAGLGNRFAKEGYLAPKPFIPIRNIPMAAAAALDLPSMAKQKFILRREHQPHLPSLKNHFPQATYQFLEETTEGQASTCLAALSPRDRDEPLLIAACDCGLRFDFPSFLELLNNPAIDVIVFGAQGFPGASRNPHAYGWMKLNADRRVIDISVKVPFDERGIKQDPVITGAFYFRKAATFVRCAEEMIKANRRVNGEFYVDEAVHIAVERGLYVHCIDVSSYLCWGTPNELRTYEYWDQCFQSWPKSPTLQNMQKRFSL